jgi:hypothetical protein
MCEAPDVFWLPLFPSVGPKESPWVIDRSIRALSWIGFSEDDGREIAEGANN